MKITKEKAKEIKKEIDGYITFNAVYFKKDGSYSVDSISRGNSSKMMYWDGTAYDLGYRRVLDAWEYEEIFNSLGLIMYPIFEEPTKFQMLEDFTALLNKNFEEMMKNEK